MKTTLSRIKSVLQADANLSTYIKKVEVVSPRLLPDLSSTLVPYIGVAPVGTSETWIAQMKQATHNVDLYIVNWLQIQESSIMGDTVKKGLLEIETDVKSAIRGQRLSSGGQFYLSKPIEIMSVNYDTAGYGDNVFLLVATIGIQCIRLFDITLPS